MKRSSSAGGIVVNNSSQVIIVNQRGTSWSFPKGHLEEGEDPVKTAEREIFEESGVKELQFVEALGKYERPNLVNPNEVKTINMFLFTTNQQELSPQDSNISEARWVDKDKVTDLLTAEKDEEFYLSIANKI